ncbi:hypothetical protein ABPG75_006382 [Micractinium tetrahymenae]
MGCFCVGRPKTAGDSSRPTKGGLPGELEALKQKQSVGLPDGGDVLIRAAVLHSAGPEGSNREANAQLPSGLDGAAEQHGSGASEGLEQEGSAASAEPLLAEAEPAGDGDAAGAASSSSIDPEAAGAVCSHMDEQVDEQGQLSADGGSGMMGIDGEEGTTAEAAPAAGREAGGEPTAAEGAGSNRSSQQEMQSSPREEGSQAALLPTDDPSHFSLKQPRFSRLSSLLSACTTSRSVDDNGERRSKQQPQLPQQDGTQQQQQQQQQRHEGWPPALDFNAAAAELVLLPRPKLLPLAQPEQALADAAGMLGRQVVPVLLAALLTLRRVAIHHPHLLDDSLEDVSQVLLECLHGSDAAVAQAAVQALLDLMVSYGGGMLRHLEHAGALPQHSCLLGLLLAASRGRTPGIRAWANEALRFMAEKMHQSRVIRLLERYLEHELPHVRSKAAEYLLIATYRRPDTAGSVMPSRPVSPGKPWQS